MLISRKEIYIEWGDCDPEGIVYFPRYFEYFDACTFRLFTSVGLSKPDMMKKYGIAGIPVVNVRAQFFVPSAYTETVVVESCVSEWGNSSFTVHHRLLRGGVLAVEVFEKRVWVVRPEGGPQRLKGSPIPQEVKDKFKGDSSRTKK